MKTYDQKLRKRWLRKEKEADLRTKQAMDEFDKEMKALSVMRESFSAIITKTFKT